MVLHLQPKEPTGQGVRFGSREVEESREYTPDGRDGFATGGWTSGPARHNPVTPMKARLTPFLPDSFTVAGHAWSRGSTHIHGPHFRTK